jgi:hypothetical protein
MTDNEHKEMEENTQDNKNTISSKLSTDQLICKSPQESPNSSVKLEKIIIEGDDSSLLCLGLMQFIFGFLMVVFGGMVIHYDSSLSQVSKDAILISPEKTLFQIMEIRTL